MMLGMPRITESRRAQQRQRIVDAMITCMRRQGLAKTSMADVSEESGLSAGAIYGYFAGKDELLLAVAMRALESHSEAVAELSRRRPVPPPSQILRALLGEVPQEALEGGVLLQVWAAAVQHDGMRDAVLVVFSTLDERVGAYLRAWFAQTGREDPAASARRAGPALTALTQGFLLRASLTGRRDVDAFVEAVGALLDPDASHR